MLSTVTLMDRYMYMYLSSISVMCHYSIVCVCVFAFLQNFPVEEVDFYLPQLV